MKKLLLMIGTLVLLVFVPRPSVAQLSTRLDSVVCNPYNPEDTVGEVIWNLLNEYNRFGHFSNTLERTTKTAYKQWMQQMFVPLTMLPNDLLGSEQFSDIVSIDDYIVLGEKRGYVPYTLIAGKVKFCGVKSPKDTVYTGYVRLFKLFSDTVRLDKEYELGVFYELEIQLNTETLRAWISNVTFLDQRLYTNFLLTSFGYQGNSEILLTNNLDQLVGYKPPPKPKVAVLTKSNYNLRAGYVSSGYLKAENFLMNENPEAFNSSVQSGILGGFQFQKAYGTKGFFGILFGLEYEKQTYEIAHRNISLRYTRDCDGNVLTDLEGGTYERKRADISVIDESGQMTYIRPEVGLFINIPFKPNVTIQVFSALGNAFRLSSTYQAQAIVSYSGTKEDYVIENEPALGFYTDQVVNYSGRHQNAQNFMFYRLGLAFDFQLAPWSALSLQVEYRNALTYALRFRNYPCIYLDPDDMRSFVSQLDALNSSRSYNAVALNLGIKIFLKEKRQQL